MNSSYRIFALVVLFLSTHGKLLRLHKKFLLTLSSVLCLGLVHSTSLADIRVNVGGGAYTDSLGETWLADTDYNTGGVSTRVVAIAGTVNDILHYQQRWDSAAAPDLSYSFEVPNGNYAVTLHFAETYSGASGTGLRVFDVLMENALVFDGIDIFSEAGGANTALTKTAPSVTVSDGLLDIQFSHQAQSPTLSAIEISLLPNSAPVIEPVAAQSIPAGQMLNFNIVASDVDGSVPIFFCKECPPEATLDATNGTFKWQPALGIDTSEPYRVIVLAFDSVDFNLIAEESFYITVADAAPELAVIHDATAVEGNVLQIPLFATAASGNPPQLSVIIFNAPLTDTLEASGYDHTYSRASSATYYDMTGKLIHVPVDTPRFLDNEQGLLIEGLRTNLVAPSINLGASSWVDNSGGISIDSYGIAPDGTMTSSLVIGNATPWAGRKTPVTLAPDAHYETPKGCYASKVHVKAGDSLLSRHGIYNTTGDGQWESFVELSWNNGTPSVATNSGTTKDDPVAQGDIYLVDTGYQGWWTLVFSFCKEPLPNPTDTTFFHVEPDRLGTSKSIQVWGAQLEYGHLSTSYIHNTGTIPAVREPDLLTYDIGSAALGFPENNTMIESKYLPQWRSSEIRGWHPRFWGSKTSNSYYSLARTSRSSANFVATRTFNGNAHYEDVTHGPNFDKGQSVRVMVQTKSNTAVEIIPDFISNGPCAEIHPNCILSAHNQPWGPQLMIGNLIGPTANNLSIDETDGPLNAPTRHMRVHVLDAATANSLGVSLVNGVFTWKPPVGSSAQGPYVITVRATDADDPSIYVQQDVELTVTP